MQPAAARGSHSLRAKVHVGKEDLAEVGAEEQSEDGNHRPLSSRRSGAGCSQKWNGELDTACSNVLLSVRLGRLEAGRGD